MNKTTYFHVRSRQDFKDRFIKFCKKNGFIYSKRIRALMEMDMRGEIKK